MHCVICGSEHLQYLGEVAHLLNWGIDWLIVDVYECLDCGRGFWGEDLESMVGCPVE